MQATTDATAWRSARRKALSKKLRHGQPGAMHRPGAQSAWLLPATSDIARHATGSPADERAGPCVAARDRRNACAACRADRRAAHRALLLRAHVRAADQDHKRRRAHDPSKSFHDRLLYGFFFRPGTTIS